MIALIPYTNDHHNGEELRYSIRSLVKYFKDLSGIMVIGNRPTWLKQEHHIHCLDEPGRKEYSMYLKVMLGARLLEVDRFLYTTDDHFALKPFEENLPNYYYETCAYRALNDSDGRYRMQYKNCPAGWLNYDIHAPIVMRPFKWPSPAKWFDTPIKSSYANQAGVKGTEMKDCKFANGHSYEQIKEITKDRLFFSTSPFCMNSDMKQFLEEQYPNKSIYEI